MLVTKGSHLDAVQGPARFLDVTPCNDTNRMNQVKIIVHISCATVLARKLQPYFQSVLHPEL